MIYLGFIICFLIIVGIERYVKKNPDKLSPKAALIIFSIILIFTGTYTILYALTNESIAGFIFGPMFLFAGLFHLFENIITKKDKLKEKYEKMFKVKVQSENNSNT